MSNNLLNNTTSLQNILEALQNKAAGGGGIDTTDATATANDILSGKTAYAGGQKIMGNIAFAPAKIITPSITDQIAVSSRYYTSGDIIVTGDSNLVAGNIKKGTSIFGVTGSYEGSGDNSGNSVDEFLATDYITYTNETATKIGIGKFAYQSDLTSVSFPVCSYIGTSAFYFCSSLTSVSFPVCSYIGIGVFQQCSSLTSVSFPVCSYIGNNAFYNCLSLTSANFPVCSFIGHNGFNKCISLTSVSFPVCSYIGNYAFSNCSRLTSADFGNNSTIFTCSIYASVFTSCITLTNLTLRYSFVATLSNINAFTSTPMSLSTLTGSFGSIYVPSSLVASYKAATNWATYADRITAIVE